MNSVLWVLCLLLATSNLVLVVFIIYNFTLVIHETRQIVEKIEWENEPND